jgi:hypothetical protein
MSSGKEGYLNSASIMYDNTTMYKEQYPNKDDYLNMMSKRYDERFGLPIVKEEPVKETKETKEKVIRPGRGSSVLQKMYERFTRKGGKRRKYASKKNKKRKTNKRKH